MGAELQFVLLEEFFATALLSAAAADDGRWTDVLVLNRFMNSRNQTRSFLIESTG